MPAFTYKAMNKTGQEVTGTLTAESQQAALRMLDDRALFPTQVAEGGVGERKVIGGRRKVRLQHLTLFYSQLSDLLSAGVPMLRAIDVISRQSMSPVLSEILKDVRDDVASGHALADSMEKHPNAFAALHVSMVRAGETGGFLEDVLTRIAGFAEKQDELRGKLIGSMIYPCILVTVGISVVSFLLVFVVPKLEPFLRRQALNPLTEFVFTMCNVLRNYGFVVLAGVVAATIVAVAFFRSESGEAMFDRIKLRFPVVGKIIRMVAICRFCRILGTMMSSGVPVLQSLGISKDSAGSKTLSDGIAKATESVRKGETLSKPLGETELFPLDIIDMIAVAEESNSLDRVLVQIADKNEARTARQIDLAVRLIEPVLLVVMATVVLLIAMALLLPILTMSTGGISNR